MLNNKTFGQKQLLVYILTHKDFVNLTTVSYMRFAPYCAWNLNRNQTTVEEPTATPTRQHSTSTVRRTLDPCYLIGKGIVGLPPPLKLSNVWKTFVVHCSSYTWTYLPPPPSVWNTRVFSWGITPWTKVSKIYWMWFKLSSSFSNDQIAFPGHCTLLNAWVMLRRWCKTDRFNGGCPILLTCQEYRFLRSYHIVYGSMVRCHNVVTCMRCIDHIFSPADCKFSSGDQLTCYVWPEIRRIVVSLR